MEGVKGLNLANLLSKSKKRWDELLFYIVCNFGKFINFDLALSGVLGVMALRLIIYFRKHTLISTWLNVFPL